MTSPLSHAATPAAIIQPQYSAPSAASVAAGSAVHGGPTTTSRNPPACPLATRAVLPLHVAHSDATSPVRSALAPDSEDATSTSFGASGGEVLPVSIADAAASLPSTTWTLGVRQPLGGPRTILKNGLLHHKYQIGPKDSRMFQAAVTTQKISSQAIPNLLIRMSRGGNKFVRTVCLLGMLANLLPRALSQLVGEGAGFVTRGLATDATAVRESFNTHPLKGALHALLAWPASQVVSALQILVSAGMFAVQVVTTIAIALVITAIAIPLLAIGAISYALYRLGTDVIIPIAKDQGVTALAVLGYPLVALLRALHRTNASNLGLQQLRETSQESLALLRRQSASTGSRLDRAKANFELQRRSLLEEIDNKIIAPQRTFSDRVRGIYVEKWLDEDANRQQRVNRLLEQDPVALARLVNDSGISPTEKAKAFAVLLLLQKEKEAPEPMSDKDYRNLVRLTTGKTLNSRYQTAINEDFHRHLVFPDVVRAANFILEELGEEADLPTFLRLEEGEELTPASRPPASRDLALLYNDEYRNQILQGKGLIEELRSAQADENEDQIALITTQLRAILSCAFTMPLPSLPSSSDRSSLYESESSPSGGGGGTSVTPRTVGLSETPRPSL